MLNVAYNEIADEQVIYMNKLVQELNNSLSENLILKKNIEKSDKMLYELIQGLRDMEALVEIDDYYFEVERLLSGEVEVWYEATKVKVEAERIRLIRLNALNKLSDEEKQALGLI